MHVSGHAAGNTKNQKFQAVKKISAAGGRCGTVRTLLSLVPSVLPWKSVNSNGAVQH
jgi:hypothetical protein